MRKSSKFLLTCLTCATVFTGMSANAVTLNNGTGGTGIAGRGLTDNRLGYNYNYNGYNNTSLARDMNYRGFRNNNIPSVADNYNTPNNLGTAVNTDNNINGMSYRTDTAGTYRNDSTAGAYSSSDDRSGAYIDGTGYYNRDSELNSYSYNRTSPRVTRTRRNASGMGNRMRTANSRTESVSRRRSEITDNFNRGTSSRSAIQAPAATSRTARTGTARSETARNERRAATQAPRVRKARSAQISRSAAPVETTTRRAAETTVKKSASRSAKKASRSAYKAPAETTVKRSAVRTTTRKAPAARSTYRTTNRANRPASNYNNYATRSSSYNNRNRTNVNAFDNNNNYRYGASMPRGNYRASSSGYAYGAPANYRTAVRPATADTNRVSRATDNTRIKRAVTPRVNNNMTNRAVNTRAARYRNTAAESRNATITFVILLVAIAALLALAIYALMRPRHERSFSSDSENASRRR